MSLFRAAFNLPYLDETAELLLFDESNFFENFFVGAILVMIFCNTLCMNARKMRQNTLNEFHLLIEARFLVFCVELNIKTSSFYKNTQPISQ